MWYSSRHRILLLSKAKVVKDTYEQVGSSTKEIVNTIYSPLKKVKTLKADYEKEVIKENIFPIEFAVI